MGKVRNLDTFRIHRGWIVLLALLASLWTALCYAGSPGFSLKSSDENRIVLELESSELEIQAENIGGNLYSRLSMAGAASSAGEGSPDLPVYSGRVVIPANASYNISYECLNPRDYEVARPMPVLPESGRSLVLSEVYRESAEYPAEHVNSGGDGWLRDFRVLSLQVCPVAWEPIRARLRRFEKIRVFIELSYPEGRATPYTSYSYAFKDVYEAQILNFGDYRNLVHGPSNSKVLIIHGEYNNAIFRAKLNEFIAWKRQKGFDVTVASTSVAGNSNVEIKAYIQSLYNNPETRPDYIILVGDVTGNFPVPTWYEVESGYNGEGDDPYTKLCGNDDLVDAFIGRISAEDTSQLGTILNKIYAYEKNVDNSTPAGDWLNRMLLIGDPFESGISCAYVTHHIHEIAQEVNPDYSFIEDYGNHPAPTMTQGMNQGVGFFTYRGIYGVSGWDPATPLYNGNKLPHSAILTCGTGSFGSTAFSEVLIRQGTEAVPAGAVTCVGMATTGTHTALNNSLMVGMMDGVFSYGMRTMGEALLNGKLYTHAVYASTMPAHVRFFSHWCNLMGDPTLETWVGLPKTLNLSVPQEIPVGTTLVQIEVLDGAFSPVETASVTAYSPGEDTILAKAFTGADGIAYLNLPEGTTQILVTAAKHNFKPVQQIVAFNPEGSLAYNSLNVIDDGSQGSLGNGDGIANPGETIALELGILNSMDTAVNGFTAQIASLNPHVEIITAGANYPAMGAGDISCSINPFLIRLSSNIAPLERIRFALTLSGDFGADLVIQFYLNGYNACLEPLNYSISAGGDNVLDPGETASLSLQIRNDGSYLANDLMGKLTSLNSLVSVGDSLSTFGTLLPGAEAASAQSFGITAHSRLVPGMQIPLKLELTNAAGFNQFCIFNIPVGIVTQNDPLGPDEYGYLIYDTTDTSYPECPVYDWIEINPNLGGLGVEVPNLWDSGIWFGEGDDYQAKSLAVLDLPFIFPFYGIGYSTITVCTNGFIAFGRTDDGEFRNTVLPGGQGPAPMIAAFWDDMVLAPNGVIYEYYDAANHQYIIQYNNMKNGYDDETPETFQVIFYDPMVYYTGLGDGMIKIQYKEFNNIDVGGFNGNTPLGGNFCTVGIKDHTNTRGLQYTFNNTYPQAAAPLSHESAILITTVPHIYTEARLQPVQVIVMDENGDSLLASGETAEIGIKLRNLGTQTARDVSFTIRSDSDYLSVLTPTSTYPDVPGGITAVNDIPLVICVADSCPNNQLINVPCTITMGDTSLEYSLILEVKKPLLSFAGSYMNDYIGNDNGILEPGENATLLAVISNNSPVAASNISCSITANPAQIAVLDSLVHIDTVPGNSQVVAAFDIVVDPTVYNGTNALYYMNLSSEVLGSQTVQAYRKIGSNGTTQSFESNSGSYVTSLDPGWAWGSSSLVEAHSGTKLWATVLDGNYSADVDMSLLSQSLYITGNSYLEFWYYMDSELGRDGGKLQYFRSGVYTDLEPLGGYPCAYVEALGGPGYSGQTGWVKAKFDIRDITGSSIRFRWLFSSDAQNEGLGWYIDDVSVIGYDGVAGLVRGQVHLESDRIAHSDIWVRNQDMISALVDSTGAFDLYLPIGEHDLTVYSPGCQAAGLSDVNLYPGHNSSFPEFELIEFKPVESLEMSLADDALHLAWEAPRDSHYPVKAYKVLRKLNASGFDELALVQDAWFDDELSIPGIYYYQVLAVYDLGESLPCRTDSLSYPSPLVPPPPPPAVSRLYANYPNPFNPNTTISFDLATAGEVELQIFNLRGQKVKTLLRSSLEAGTYQYIWDGTDGTGRRVGSGVYFYRLHAPHYTNARRMILLK